MVEPKLLRTGWWCPDHIPTARSKWHWIKEDGRSLCGKWLCLAGSLEQGNDNSPDNCKKCREKKASLNSSAPVQEPLKA